MIYLDLLSQNHDKSKAYLLHFNNGFWTKASKSDVLVTKYKSNKIPSYWLDLMH